jgi:hypothetical protein
MIEAMVVLVAPVVAAAAIIYAVQRARVEGALAMWTITARQSARERAIRRSIVSAAKHDVPRWVRARAKEKGLGIW